MARNGLLEYSQETSHLPPISHAPILQFYDYEQRKLDSTHLIPAPLDDRGVVDVGLTLDIAMSKVDPSYCWPKSHCDVHHFVWERNNYLPINNNGSNIPNLYREIPFHKGYLPRQLHNFIHTAIAPPPVPVWEVMEQRVKGYLLAKRLFETARIAMRFERRPGSLTNIKKDKYGEVLLEDEILRDILGHLRDQYSAQLSDFNADETELFDPESIRHQTIRTAATHLGRIAAIRSVNLLPRVYANRAA
jgi:hypothetical protein